jgi:hypothetical protein
LTSASHRPGFCLAIKQQPTQGKTMTTTLKELLESGQDLIGQVEDAKEALQSDIESLNDAANGAEAAPVLVGFLRHLHARFSCRS